MATNRSIVPTTTVSLIVALAALLSIVAMTFWLSEQAQVYFTRVVAARDARSAAVELRNAIQAAESSQRGYLVSGNEIYLAPYDTAKTLAQRRLTGVIDELKSYNAPAASHLNDVVRDKFAEMDESIALKKARRDDQALATFNKNLGKALMDEANVFFAGIIRAADERLTAAAAEERRSAAWLRSASILGGIVIVAVVSLAVVAARRYTRELANARDEVAEINAQLEDRVKRRTSDLARANDEIQRFAHIVTHDLRAPLVNIMGFAGELDQSARELQDLIGTAPEGGISTPLRQKLATVAAEDMPEAIGFIRSSTRKMDGLINAILRLSREGRRSLDLQQLDLEQLIRASVDTVRHQISEADGTVTFDIDVSHIITDRLSLEQIIGNLLDNAVKYRSRERPLKIGISAHPSGERRYRIEIIDNGRGIAERDLPAVFDIFTRSGSQDQPGEGIGLAFVQRLVRNLDGQIAVTSQLGAGTSFVLTFPDHPKIELQPLEQ